MPFVKGQSGNPKGRVPNAAKNLTKTNRELRQEEFMAMVRKFKPHLSTAVKIAVEIMNNREANESSRLRASALIISTYKDLLKDLYSIQYDEEQAEEIQPAIKENQTVFSLKIVGIDEEEEKAA